MFEIHYNIHVDVSALQEKWRKEVYANFAQATPRIFLLKNYMEVLGFKIMNCVSLKIRRNKIKILYIWKHI